MRDWCIIPIAAWSMFRTGSDQAAMRAGVSGSNPAAKMSPHEAGLAVDFNGTSQKSFKTIVAIMKRNGFVWGGDFKPKQDLPILMEEILCIQRWGSPSRK